MEFDLNFDKIIIPTQSNGKGLKFVDLLNEEQPKKRSSSYDLRYSMNTTTNKVGETVIKRSFLLKKSLIEGQTADMGWVSIVGEKDGKKEVYLIQVKEPNSIKLPILFCKGEKCSNKITSESLFINLKSAGMIEDDDVEKDFDLEVLTPKHPEIFSSLKIKLKEVEQVEEITNTVEEVVA